MDTYNNRAHPDFSKILKKSIHDLILDWKEIYIEQYLYKVFPVQSFDQCIFSLFLFMKLNLPLCSSSKEEVKLYLAFTFIVQMVEIFEVSKNFILQKI